MKAFGDLLAQVLRLKTREEVLARKLRGSAQILIDSHGDKMEIQDPPIMRGPAKPIWLSMSYSLKKCKNPMKTKGNTDNRNKHSDPQMWRFQTQTFKYL